MKQNYITMTKKLNDKNEKYINLLKLIISLLTLFEIITLFGFGVKFTPDINPNYVYMDRPCPNDSKKF